MGESPGHHSYTIISTKLMVSVLPPCPPCSEAKREIFHPSCFLLECSFFKQEHSGAVAIGIRASF